MSSLGPRRVTAFLVSSALLFSSTAASAASLPVPATAISPWAALSAFGTQASRASLCGASTAAVAGAAAAAAQAVPGQPGCVFPVVDAPPPALPAQAQPLPPPPAPVGGGGISPLVLALGGLALAGLIYLLVHNNESGSPK